MSAPPGILTFTEGIPDRHLPAGMLCNPALSPAFVRLYGVLLTYLDRLAPPPPWPGQQILANQCGVSLRTIQYTLNELKAARLLTTHAGAPNEYRVHPYRAMDADFACIIDADFASVSAGTTTHKTGPDSLLDNIYISNTEYSGPLTIDVLSQTKNGHQPPPDSILTEIPTDRDPGNAARSGGGGGGDLGEAITAATGIASSTVADLLALGRERGRPDQYFWDLLAYVTRTPNLLNPAGAFIKAVQRNDYRRPPAAPDSAPSSYLDVSKYHEGGKYAHLFSRPGPLVVADYPTQTEDWQAIRRALALITQREAPPRLPTEAEVGRAATAWERSRLNLRVFLTRLAQWGYTAPIGEVLSHLEAIEPYA